MSWGSMEEDLTQPKFSGKFPGEIIPESRLNRSCRLRGKGSIDDYPDRNRSRLPIPHHLLEFAQVHVHCIGDAIQPSHPLLPSSASTFPVRGCDMALLNNCEVGSRGSEGWERR